MSANEPTSMYIFMQHNLRKRRKGKFKTGVEKIPGFHILCRISDVFFFLQYLIVRKNNVDQWAVYIKSRLDEPYETDMYSLNSLLNCSTFTVVHSTIIF